MTGFRITYVRRSTGRARNRYFKTLEAATAAANEIFRRTGIVLGIEAVTRKGR